MVLLQRISTVFRRDRFKLAAVFSRHRFHDEAELTVETRQAFMAAREGDCGDVPVGFRQWHQSFGP